MKTIEELISDLQARKMTIEFLEKEVDELQKKISSMSRETICGDILDCFKKKSPDMWFKKVFVLFDEREDYMYYHITGVEPGDGEDLIKGEGPYYRLSHDKRVSFGGDNYIKVSIETRNDVLSLTRPEIDKLIPVSKDDVLEDIRYMSNKILAKTIE